MIPGSSAIGVHPLAIVCVVALALLGVRRGWPREALSLAALLIARALAAASPERVNSLLGGLWTALAGLVAAAARLVGVEAAPSPPPGVEVGAPDARTLLLLSLVLWLVAWPIGRALFPERPRGPAALVGLLLGAANGVLLALALLPLLPDEGLAALLERWAWRATGPWLDDYLPPLVVGGLLVIAVVAVLSGALPARRGGH